MLVLWSLALAQLRHHFGRWALLAGGIALVVAVPIVTAGVTASVSAQTIRRTVSGFDLTDRTLLVVQEADSVLRKGTPAANDAVVREQLAQLSATPALYEMLFRPLTVNGPTFQLGAVDHLSDSVHLVSGRLPQACTPTRCEVVVVGTANPPGPALGAGHARRGAGRTGATHRSVARVRCAGHPEHAGHPRLERRRHVRAEVVAVVRSPLRVGRAGRRRSRRRSRRQRLCLARCGRPGCAHRAGRRRHLRPSGRSAAGGAVTRGHLARSVRAARRVRCRAAAGLRRRGRDRAAPREPAADDLAVPTGRDDGAGRRGDRARGGRGHRGRRDPGWPARRSGRRRGVAWQRSWRGGRRRTGRQLGGPVGWAARSEYRGGHRHGAVVGRSASARGLAAAGRDHAGLSGRGAARGRSRHRFDGQAGFVRRSPRRRPAGADVGDRGAGRGAVVGSGGATGRAARAPPFAGRAGRVARRDPSAVASGCDRRLPHRGCGGGRLRRRLPRDAAGQ